MQMLTEGWYPDRITLLDMACLPMTLVKPCAASFSRSREGIPVQCEIMSGDAEDAWRRVTAELAAGKGPDILCLKSDDDRMQILHDKGVLADLTELISPEVKARCSHLGPQPSIPFPVRMIILTEARAYYNGELTLEQAVEIIDNRVQLYLDEQ